MMDDHAIRDSTPEDDAMVARWGRELEDLGYLYRYVSLADERRRGWFEDAVLRSSLHFSSFSSFNDPFDGAVELLYDATPNEIRRFWNQSLTDSGEPINEQANATIERCVSGASDPEVHRLMRAAYRDGVLKLGIVCMSALRDHIPMWGYYADSHRGAVLRFRAEALVGWEDCFPPMPVVYSDDYPRASFYRDSRARRGHATILTKSKLWCHEHEWRMIRQSFGSMAFPAEALDGVIMGHGIAPEIEDRVRSVVAARHPRVELMKAHLADRRFGLEVRPA